MVGRCSNQVTNMLPPPLRPTARGGLSASTMSQYFSRSCFGVSAIVAYGRAAGLCEDQAMHAFLLREIAEMDSTSKRAAEVSSDYSPDYHFYGGAK